MNLEPCKDKSIAPDIVTSFLSHGQQPQEQKGSGHNDQCPPLCHCGCCNIQVVIVPKILLEFREVKFTPIRSVYIPRKPITRPSNIWQPPKLVA